MADPQHPDIAALEPCPFCGGNPHVRARLYDPTQGVRYQVQCAECHCGTSERFEGREYAAAAWNRRTLARPVEDEEVRQGIEWLDNPLWKTLPRDVRTGHVALALLLARLAREKASAGQEAARLREIVEAARHMPRATTAPGAACDCHVYRIESSAAWALDRAFKNYERALAAASGAEEPR